MFIYTTVKGDEKVLPKIGLSFSEAFDRTPGNFLIPSNYINSIIDNGGIPVILPVTSDTSFAKEYAMMLDGLLIPGGEDINPLLYGEDSMPKVTYMNMVKDEFEIALIKEFYNLGKPIMGICRGMQLINVVFGGNLIQDIPSREYKCISHEQAIEIPSEPTHEININKSSFLYRTLGKESIVVNSYHHQAIDRIADGFIVSAIAKDGIVEAIENKEKNIFAVQWHPECMYKRFEDISKIFKLLCEKASEH